MMSNKTTKITSLKLFNYRNYSQISLEFNSNIIVLHGDNGVGKTNIMEAITFLSSGRNMRSAKLSEVTNFAMQNTPWGVNAKIENANGEEEIGVGLGYTKEAHTEKKIIKINGDVVNKKAILDEYISVYFLTPDKDQTFSNGTTSRREFLDDICSFFHKPYAELLAAYEKLKSQRLRLILKSGIEANNEWLSAIEKQMAEKAIAIAFYRLETIEKLNDHSDFIAKTSFPSFECCVEGESENMLKIKKSIEVEGYFYDSLAQNRVKDFERKRTNFGIHRSDFKVINKIKNLPTEICSTGEQKSMLISVSIGAILHKKNWGEISPIILLDEVVSHLDEKRRLELFELFKNLKCQVFLSGTDEKMFEPLAGNAQFIGL